MSSPRCSNVADRFTSAAQGPATFAVGHRTQTVGSTGTGLPVTEAMLGVRWAELVPGREADLGSGLSEAALQASPSVLSPISDFSKAPLAPHNPLFGLPYCSGVLTPSEALCLLLPHFVLRRP